METREKMTPTRKAIAKAMVNSKHTAPHVTLHDEVEVSKLWDHRKKFKDVAAANGTKLTFLPYVVKALTSTVQKFPILNASIDDAAQEIVYKITLTLVSLLIQIMAYMYQMLKMLIRRACLLSLMKSTKSSIGYRR